MPRRYNNVKGLMLGTFLLTLTVACSKSFLDIKPKGIVIASKTTDYDLLLNNLALINMGTDGHIILGDEVSAVDPQWTGATFREKQLFQWQGDIYTPDQDAPETLVPVKDLYIYNKIINEAMGSTGGTDATKKSLQAEAYAGRAWTYFLLINYYGQPYNPATADTDPGFPLIIAADINASNFTRASVQKVYDLIVSDLTTAIPNLTAVGVPFRTRMSQAAALGLLAKVYIFMGKFSEALPLLDQSINDLSQSIVPTSLLDYNTAFPGFPTAPNDPENIYAKVIFNNYTGSSNAMLTVTPETAALYDTTDVRLSKWYKSTSYPNGSVLLKRSNSYSTYFGLRVPELYLLRAEVKARLDDLQGAVSDLLYFRQHRMPAANAVIPASVVSDKLALLPFIIQERIREFAVQGYRWFDMRRLSVDPSFTPVDYRHRVYAVTGDLEDSFKLDAPKRYVFRIPPKILAENPTMEDNP